MQKLVWTRESACARGGGEEGDRETVITIIVQQWQWNKQREMQTQYNRETLLLFRMPLTTENELERTPEEEKEEERLRVCESAWA